MPLSSARRIRFLPFKLAKERLDPSALKASETNLMPEKTLQELLKTANTFAQDPWQLLKTQAWLEKFCEQNQARVFPDAVALVHIFNPKESLLPLAVSLEDVDVEAEEAAADPPAPRTVRVLRPKRKALKRPSAVVQPGRRVVLRRPAAAAASESAEAAGPGQGNEVAPAPAALAAPSLDAAIPASLHGGDDFFGLTVRYEMKLLFSGPSKCTHWNFERKSAQTVRKSCKHARLAHSDQTNNETSIV